LIQTIYAVLAIMIASLFIYNQQANLLSAKSDMIESEVDLLAATVAADLIERMDSLPFDSAGTVSDPNELTPAAGFGGAVHVDSASFLSELHNLTQTVWKPAGKDSVAFDATFTVQYLEKQGSTFVPAATQTYYKKVLIAVEGPLDQTFVLESLFSYF
jgi:hypothetical protein